MVSNQAECLPFLQHTVFCFNCYANRGESIRTLVLLYDILPFRVSVFLNFCQIRHRYLICLCQISNLEIATCFAMFLIGSCPTQHSKYVHHLQFSCNLFLVFIFSLWIKRINYSSGAIISSNSSPTRSKESEMAASFFFNPRIRNKGSPRVSLGLVTSGRLA